MTSRPPKVTPEQRKESERLRAIWDATEPRPNQTIFGELHQIGSQSAVGQFLNGHAPISAKAAAGFARGLKCSIWDFSPRLAREIQYYASSLDCSETSSLDARASERNTAYVAMPSKSDPWPFISVSKGDLSLLDKSEISLIEAYMRALVDRKKSRVA